MSKKIRSQVHGKDSNGSLFAVPREVFRLSRAWVAHGVFGFPVKLGRSFLKDPALDGPLSESKILDLFGENILALFNDLGPLYGKAGQMVLSRLSPPMHEVAEALRITRLYKDWSPIPFATVETILDREIPQWRTELQVNPHPIGVASLAQVHGATDRDGKEWVVKIIKPQARARLLESVAALEQVAGTLEPVAVTLVARRLIKEIKELCIGFRRELDLTRERETILRVKDKLKKRRQKLLLIPDVHESLCSDAVLTVERFHGISLADVVNGRAELPQGFKAKLARTMLHELLIQVFELGLFHADPHAGNLILTLDGSVGLFDWGLAGELMESDRRHIAAILKAVIALDRDLLVDALLVMAEESGTEVDRDDVEKELRHVVRMIKKGKQEGAEKPSMQQLFEACLKGADKLGIPIPEGLLMMVKSLITIEGLAKGIDPKVSMARIASPVLFKASRPGLKEFISLGKRLPVVLKTVMASQPESDTSTSTEESSS